MTCPSATFPRHNAERSRDVVAPHTPTSWSPAVRHSARTRHREQRPLIVLACPPVRGCETPGLGDRDRAHVTTAASVRELPPSAGREGANIASYARAAGLRTSRRHACPSSVVPHARVRAVTDLRRNLEDDSGRVRAGGRVRVAHLVRVGAKVPELVVVQSVVRGRDQLHAVPPNVDVGYGIWLRP